MVRLLEVVAATMLRLSAPSRDDVPALQAAKNVGLAALEEGNLAEASRRFAAVRKLAPGEPLGWANGAVVSLRGKDLATAQKLLAEALRLAPGDGAVLALEGTRLELAADAAGAIAAFEKAATARPKDLPSRWNAARLQAERGPEGRVRAIADVQAALAEAPVNLFLLLRLCEYAREAGDAGLASSAHDRIAHQTGVEAKTDKALAVAGAALEAGDARTASLRYRVAENLLRVTPRYQQARHDVDPGVIGLPLEDWSPALAEKVRARSARGVPVRFVARADAGLAALSGVSAVRAFGRDGRDLVFAGDRGLRVATAGPGGYRVGTPVAASASPGFGLPMRRRPE